MADPLRSQVIRLAYVNPSLRRHLLPILASTEREGMEFPTQEALKKYLDEHPGADKSKHSVAKPGGGGKANREHIKRIPEAFHKYVDDLPTKSMQSQEEALKNPKVKELVETLRKLPLEEVDKMYDHFQANVHYLGGVADSARRRGDKEAENAAWDTQAQVRNAFHAAKQVRQEMKSKKASLREAMIRHANASLRPHLLPILAPVR